jgi:hypothetical protein
VRYFYVVVVDNYQSALAMIRCVGGSTLELVLGISHVCGVECGLSGWAAAGGNGFECYGYP